MILLDTCALLWLAHDQARMSDETLRRINETPLLYVSAITAFEIGVKHKAGKLRLPVPPRVWLEGILSHHDIAVIDLDSLVCRGTVFTRAVCPHPICVPSRAEIITGCTGFRNGVTYFSKKINPELPTWAGTMRDAGYRTWYVVKWHSDGTPTQRGYDETQGLFMGGGKRRTAPAFDAKGRGPKGHLDETGGYAQVDAELFSP